MESAFFLVAVAVSGTRPVLAALLILMAALALCLSLHMSYHEAAHRSGSWPDWRRILTGLLLTPLMGASFHGYRVSHWNHHRYDNGLEDFTTTWKGGEGDPQPKHLLSYCLSWPKIFIEGPVLFKTAVNDGDANAKILRWARGEAVFLLSWLIFLAWLSPITILLYVSSIYLGWALISLHNFGQHLPRDYGTPYRTTSFQAHWYNRLFFNNGLHFEHHRRPAVPIADLHADEAAELVAVPHLLAPFVGRR